MVRPLGLLAVHWLLFGGLASLASELPRGILDVTAAPYNVDNTGATDCTRALQRAVDAARAGFLAALLPHGTYLVSDTITLLQSEPWEPGNSSWVNNTFPCRFQPNILLGSRARWAGDGQPVRPTIRLADHAPKFNNPARPRPVLDFTRANNGHVPTVDGTNFNQLLRGIDVNIGAGTPGATGVMMPGAQGCAVADVTIRVGSGYSGITGGSGAGGGHGMVTVIGGRVGLDYTVSMNTPGTTGAVLINQTEAAILYDGFEAASFVGALIRPASAGVPVLRSRTSGSMWGQVSIVDSIVEYPAEPAEATRKCVAADTSHSLYLKNVFVHNCGQVAVGVAGAAAGWARVDELSVGVPIPTPNRSCGSASMPVLVDGAERPGDVLVRVAGGQRPPSSLLAQHRWDERLFPAFDLPGLLDVTAFGAKGDGKSDDTDAIQRAIDTAQKSGAAVLLPKGFYRVSKTINMTASALVGAARTLSVLMPMSDGLTGMGVAGPSPILHVVPSPPGVPPRPVTITMLGIVTWEHLDSVWAMWWQNSHPESVYRDNYFYRITECFYGFPNPIPIPVPATSPTIPCKREANLSHPLNVISDGGAGKFYNFENEDFLYEAKDYRHLLIRDTTGPLRLYNMNFEHASSEANAEFRNASDIYVFSLKSEGEWRDMIFNDAKRNPAVVLWVRNCRDVNIFSYGGNARPPSTGSTYPAGFAQYPPSLYRIEDSCPVRVTNCVDQFQFEPDNNWNFVYERFAGTETLTGHCVRPALYARTTCASDLTVMV
mmetsp:Transcript_45621/g.130178  ORF Transcript_45621/g.130178 Transcript_45621/m.130178 type:complete len:771 (-) Transcript_45621:99-2411(-)